MTLTLRVTPQAESDFVSIWLYTADAWGVKQADDYLDQLETGMGHLTVHPSLGVDCSHILPGYRKIRIEHHDVFYRVLVSEILVVRVLHEDMDAPCRLLD
ncbi:MULTISPECIES: type II toxin-antitoxin system RelE/ParE family toxin [unclassified Marinobacter]|uniref:type II toxin-antitoxin system RelE/ParE family toxin n=1 Tax=unclassified Marinobacter TaxID=83889 RepID=UPI000BF7BB6E|nr:MULTISPECIES: type II toxin-antitoxin system RelE/ParE family toxin [unclassified Marinobacter]PFG11578.1 toxin ParE1/3/4 [Marinobacter sp. LV10MA510-1]PFG53396.1 toxin ParE1/3/4 [Marinobacter sp. LV10R520-4]